MKRFILLLALSALNLRADIILNDNGTIIKDGVSLNNASDALLNKLITSAEFMTALQSKLDATNAATAKAQSDLQALGAQVTTTLNAQLATLTAQLASIAPTDTASIAATQARIDTINALIAEAGKSDKQKALDAALAAKAAADKALADAQAALQQP